MVLRQKGKCSTLNRPSKPAYVEYSAQCSEHYCLKYSVQCTLYTVQYSGKGSANYFGCSYVLQSPWYCINNDATNKQSKKLYFSLKHCVNLRNKRSSKRGLRFSFPIFKSTRNCRFVMG